MPSSFFVYENDIALGRQLEAHFHDVVYPGHPQLPEVPRKTFDDVWLPIIGERQLVVITRDKRIRYRPVERGAWIRHRVRGFVLTGTVSQSTTDSFRILDRHRDQLLAVVENRGAGPWMFGVTSTGLREIPLG